MVNQLLPERGFLVVMLGNAEVHGGDTVINATIEDLNCPFGLLSDNDAVINELVDRVKAGYMLVVYRLRRLMVDPVRLGLNHRDYEAQYSRPVLVWLGMPNGKPIRLARLLRGFLGYRKHACQSSALVVNQVLEKLGIESIIA